MSEEHLELVVEIDVMVAGTRVATPPGEADQRTGGIDTGANNVGLLEGNIEDATCLPAETGDVAIADAVDGGVYRAGARRVVGVLGGPNRGRVRVDIR